MREKIKWRRIDTGFVGDVLEEEREAGWAGLREPRIHVVIHGGVGGGGGAFG